MMTDSIETRLARLEAVERIRNLKGRYCRLCDGDHAGGFDPEKIAALFTEDGVWDAGPGMRFEGRSAIAQFFAAIPASMGFARHHATNPEINVAADAMSAVGRWHLFEPATLRDGDRAFWIFGRYEDAYVRVGSEWLFRSVRVDILANAPYETGWAGLAGAK